MAGDGFVVDPATCTLTLNGKAKSIEIFDMQGRLVSRSFGTDRVLVSGMSRGMYIIRVTDMSGNVFSKKTFLGK